MSDFDYIETPYVETKAILAAEMNDLESVDALVATMNGMELVKFQDALVDCLAAVNTARKMQAEADGL